MTVLKVSSKNAGTCARDEISLAAGHAMAMRMWQNEEPRDKASHRSPYETLGFVISGRAVLTVDGESVDLEPGDSWLVPADAEHAYRILEAFTAIECTSPPATVAGQEGS